MTLETITYSEQERRWPAEGCHILAQFDAETIVVYQAYRPDIAEFAVRTGRFGGEFSYSRMSWIKPNFLWMMFRSGWGEKPNQERTLALRLRRPFFDGLLVAAVPSSHDPGREPSIESWQAAVARSDVRLQWDPDHHPSGAALARRAIQLGIRGETLRAFGERELVEILDVSDFVAQQRAAARSRGCPELQTPLERIYTPVDPEIAAHIGLDPAP